MIENKEHMITLRGKGLSYGQIAKLFGISRQRVHQILSGYQTINHSVIHPKGWVNKIYNLVRERDEYTCQRCGFADNLLIHHINRDNTNNELTNLILLCSKCHLELHRPK